MYKSVKALRVELVRSVAMVNPQQNICFKKAQGIDCRMQPPGTFRARNPPRPRVKMLIPVQLKNCCLELRSLRVVNVPDIVLFREKTVSVFEKYICTVPAGFSLEMGT